MVGPAHRGHLRSDEQKELLVVLVVVLRILGTTWVMVLAMATVGSLLLARMQLLMETALLVKLRLMWQLMFLQRLYNKTSRLHAVSLCVPVRAKARFVGFTKTTCCCGIRCCIVLIVVQRGVAPTSTL